MLRILCYTSNIKKNLLLRFLQ